MDGAHFLGRSPAPKKRERPNGAKRCPNGAHMVPQWWQFNQRMYCITTAFVIQYPFRETWCHLGSLLGSFGVLWCPFGSLFGPFRAIWEHRFTAFASNRGQNRKHTLSLNVCFPFPVIFSSQLGLRSIVTEFALRKVTFYS